MNWSQADVDAVYARRKAEAEGYVKLLPADKPKRGMNKWEAAYADHLEMRKRAGEIEWYAFEWIRLRLADGAWFKPDFFVFTNEGEIEAHEVKGHFREAAKVRLKVAADRYPFQFVLVTRDKNSGEWVLNHLK
jgi:predicted Ser/Thr protein kinase